MAADVSDTTIGAQVELKGSLHNQGPISIYGTVIGDISSNATVFVGEGARVEGPISAKDVDIAGKVDGAVSAENKIELQPKSQVNGEISCAQLSIKPGALFVGSSQMPGTSHDSSEKRKPALEVN